MGARRSSILVRNENMALQEEAAAALEAAPHTEGGMRISGDHLASKPRPGPVFPVAVAAGSGSESFTSMLFSSRATRAATLPPSLPSAAMVKPWDILRDALRTSSDVKAGRPAAPPPRGGGQP